MKLTYDKEVDAAYIYIVDESKKGQAKKTIQLNENIILDFDEANKLIGVEILGASEILDKEVIVQARDF